MKVLFIYRNPAMGFSIGKVFHTIEQEMKKYAEVDSIYLPIPNYKPIGLWRNIMAARKAVKAKHYDIVHITGAEHYLIPFLRGQKVVVTVHDLGHYFTINKIKSSFYWVRNILPLKMADSVVAISKFAKEEILKTISIKNIIVVPDALSEEFVSMPKLFCDNNPCILHVGTRPHKNLKRTIKALEGIKCSLIIVGKIDIETKELLDITKIEYKNYINISDEELLGLYKNADIINFPSTHEGFGMPIIEGQSIGRVVITSNLEPMKSVAGNDNAVFCNPFDISSIRKAYLKVLSDNNFRKRIIEKGLINAARYIPENITKQYYNIYRSL